MRVYFLLPALALIVLAGCGAPEPGSDEDRVRHSLHAFPISEPRATADVAFEELQPMLRSPELEGVLRVAFQTGIEARIDNLTEARWLSIGDHLREAAGKSEAGPAAGIMVWFDGALFHVWVERQ
jgi:hypothetical protein